ncbi:SAF domain-containing protein [Actinoplanes sp. NPDC051475]|uniref:SAF domain-containing protein n=1 Tax=Actinoplanes sp. NPDC051475 TaxID=3157225 RepID=UPI00344CDF58
MAGARKRSTLPLLGVGVLLILLSVAVYGVITSRLDKRDPVLVLRQRVEAGQVIDAADVQAVPMSGVAGMGVFAAADSARVIGQTVVAPLPAGTLLTESMLGAQAAFPPAGQRLVSLSLKAGQYPQRLMAGAKVEVYLGVAAPATGQGGKDGQPAPDASGVPVKITASVHEVDTAAVAADGQSGAIVSLLLDDDAAARLAASADAVLLMQMPVGA